MEQLELLEKPDNLGLNKPKRNAKGQLLPGNTSNPKGRPKGKTIKERVREYLEKHPKDMDAFVRHFIKENRELAWQMIEGRPKETGEYEIKLPQPIDDVRKDNSVSQNKETEEAH